METQRDASATTESSARASRESDSRPPTEAFAAAASAMRELRSYAGYYVRARLDAAKVSVRNAGIYLALAVVAGIGAVGLIVTAVVLACVGLAQLLTTAFGGRAWAGNLVTGTLLLSMIVGGAWLSIRSITRRFRERTMEEYEIRRKRQRAEFGHDVVDRSRAETNRPKA